MCPMTPTVKQLTARLPDLRHWVGQNKRFLIKAAIVSIITVVVVETSMGWYAKHYRIVFPLQKEACLPDWNLAWVDFADRAPKRGDVYAFHAKGIKVRLSDGGEYFADGTQMMKVVAGVPGDRIDVGADVTRVNGVVEGTGLALLKTVNKPPEEIVRHVVVPPGHYFFMGRTYNSYDGRYWGFVSADQIIGKGHRIF